MAPPQLQLLRPLYLLCLSGFFGLLTVVKLIASLRPATFLHWSSFQDEWFATFWVYFGPIARENASSSVTPLVSQARGVVLDIGPGAGHWVHLFDRSKVSKVYGVEPNRGHHAALRQRVRDAGLEDVYEVIGSGVENLEDFGIAKGSVDTVVTVQCLCSVPGPGTIIQDLYSYLAPGGQWLVFEHVRARRGNLVAWYQAKIDYIWPQFFGGCSITRPTDEMLLQAGNWKSVSLKNVAGETDYDVIPHITGTLVKGER
ncbi:hypothetical protein B0A49_01766 [Cryomyces minteri]|uniref:Methyltransferase type 11 domain-containing protein n=1 Tax=Cryomyces minteri TaxID=331657 RepID=A0A4U0XZI4_9PEZI|nr:hypothetical protein B0A49_01766 [Cryomyces minteri]